MVTTEPAGFFERFAQLGGPTAREEATRVARAALGAFSSVVPPVDRRLVTAALPQTLGAAFHRDYAGPSLSRDALITEIVTTAGLARGAALEQLEIVCRVVAERMERDARQRLMRHLPDDLAPLLEPPHHEPPPPHKAHGPGGAPDRDRSVAGADGGGHTLSDGKPERAHSGSVARWHGSRADRTLGGRHEDEDEEQLAGGKPGSRRPLSEGQD